MMSDAFEKWWSADHPDREFRWSTKDFSYEAWQAALRHGAEVCREVPGDFYDPLYNCGVRDCAKTLEREAEGGK
jgi:hypothetical protein